MNDIVKCNKCGKRCKKTKREINICIPCLKIHYPKLEQKCLICENKFFARIIDKRRFCSKSCFYKWNHKENRSLYKVGHTEEVKQKIRARSSRPGKQNGMYGVRRFKDENPNYGKRWSEEKRKKLSQKLKGRFVGEKNPNWKGGKCKNLKPYPESFSEDLKRSIRKRDKLNCFLCGRKAKLFVHHIDYDKQNSCPMNLISLCQTCHVRTNSSRKFWKDFFSWIMIFRYIGMEKYSSDKNEKLFERYEWYAKNNNDNMPKKVFEFFRELQ